MNLDKLISDLQRDEGWIPYLYDDANGKRVVPGYTMIGHPSICWGFALDVSPFTMSEALPILESRAQDKWTEIQSRLPWASTVPENIQRALTNMAYQMGTSGLMKFNDFLGLLQAGKYDEAADDLESTAWFRQSGQRGPRIQTLIRGSDDHANSTS